MDPSPNYNFLNEVISHIDGWLEDYTAIRTMEMLDDQLNENISGSLLEIGVFKGKFFSVLVRSSQAGHDAVLGIDTFEYVPLAEVNNILREKLDLSNVKFVKSRSIDLTAADILTHLDGVKPRFISLDGSHVIEDVFWDLTLSENLLCQGGIIAVDDFLNPLTLGVNEAVNKFFSTPRGLAPFAYIANKLFLCRPGFVDRNIQKLESNILEDTKEIRSERFRHALKNGRHFIEQYMWNKKFLIIP